MSFAPLFGQPDDAVGPDDLRRLTVRMTAAWAAFCVGRVGPLTPPEFHRRLPFDRCVAWAWDFASGREFDRAEVARIAEILTALGSTFGQEIAPGDPGAWLYDEGYELVNVAAPYYLTQLVLDDTPEYDAESAVEAAAGVYRDFQCNRRGFRTFHDGLDYSMSLTAIFHGMTRRAYESAVSHVGEPAVGMYDGVSFPWEVEPPTPEQLEAGRRDFPTRPEQERWLRDAGWWLGPE